VHSPEAGRRWSWALAGLFAAALMWRLAYLSRLGNSILAGSLVSDSEIYWTWANWLLDHSWWGKHPFYMGPLYPYSIAGIRALFGGTAATEPILVLQAIGGAAAVALLADAARRAAGSAVIGLVVGIWAALYEMAVFFDGLVLMESQLFALEALLLWGVAAIGERRPGARALLGLGVLVGMIATGRASSLVLLPVLALVLAPGWRGVAWLAAGFALVAAPIAARNFAISGEWIPFTYNGGLNLAIGNGPEANGTFVNITGSQVVSSSHEPEGVGIDGREYIRLTTGQDLSPAASSAYWSAQAQRWIAAHPGRALELTRRRLVLLWNRGETPQVENIAEFRRVAGPLGLPWAGTFALLGPFALVGLGVVIARWRACGRGARFAAAYALTMTVVILPFFVTDRYRHHLVPAAFVLAAVALAALVAAWRARARAAAPRGLAPLVAGLAVAAVIVHLPAPGLSAAKLEWGIASDLGARYLARGQVPQALAEFEHALAIERRGAIARGAGASRALERAALYHNYAIALERAGRLDEAGRWYEAALAEAPDNAQVMQGLAGLRARQGRTGEAEQQYEAMGGRVQGGAAGAIGRGQLSAQAGRLDEARALFIEATRIDPASGDAWGSLVRLEAQAGRTAAAESALVAGEAAGWLDDGARIHRALVLALRGDRAGAAAERAGVSPTSLAAHPAWADVDRVVARLLARP
jgi:tetratricopeptide (TPR) repeat protein